MNIELTAEMMANLTRSERLVLDTLQERARAVPLSELSAVVWPGVQVRPAALRVLVSRIRKKLGRGVIVTGSDTYVLGALERCEHCGGSGFARPSR